MSNKAMFVASGHPCPDASQVAMVSAQGRAETKQQHSGTRLVERGGQNGRNGLCGRCKRDVGCCCAVSGLERSGNPIPPLTFRDFHSAALHSSPETTTRGDLPVLRTGRTGLTKPMACKVEGSVRAGSPRNPQGRSPENSGIVSSASLSTHAILMRKPRGERLDALLLRR
jgi:hypothetical protein